ncbi:recombinase family protein [Thermococcus sp. MAR1]|uniref:recombinase family protein n=1 Tax=Thermococcus sp. MAR1 TaxID=1638263 RepID=UPI001F1123EB|nr:recombinase family protein [Thermococcus sp. MAR1]
MAVFAYLRVSTSEQDINSQRQSILKKIRELGVNHEEVIWFKEEAMSGSVPALKRPIFSKLFEELEEGDILIVAELSRLGRSLNDVITLLNTLINEKRVRIVSVKENLDSAGDTMYFKIFSTIISLFADLEREFIRMRTKDGLERARKQGKRLGRPRKLNYKSILRLWEEGKSIQEIADLLDYKYSSVRKVIERMRKRGIVEQGEQRKVRWDIVDML